MSATTRIAAGLLAVAAVVIGIVIVTGGDDAYEAKVEMKNAYGVRKNSSVKIAGANGGKIKKLEVKRGPDGKDIALVTMTFKDEAAPIGAGATVTVRPTDLLGERYIALSPGNLKQPQPSGTIIRADKVSPPVELDNILNLFTSDVRSKLGVLINEFGVALEGRGTDFNALVGSLPASLGEAQKLTEQIEAENKNLGTLVTKGDSFLRTFNTRKPQFSRLIKEADNALSMVSDNRENLGRTLRSAPAALGQLRSTLGAVDRASDSLGPAADSLRAAAAPLTRTMRELPDFQNAAQDALKAATAASPAISQLGRRNVGPVRALRTTARDATGILTDAKPLTAQIGKRADKDILWGLQQLSRWVRPKDNLTHMVQASPFVTDDYLLSALDNINAFDGSKSAKARSKTRSEPDAPAPEAPKAAPAAPSAAPDKPALKLPEIRLPELPILKDLPETLKQTTQTLQDTTKGLTDALPNLGKGLQDTVGSLTQKLGNGDQKQQENSDAMGLFDYLFAP